jgi:excisionase family DNA binding protein
VDEVSAVPIPDAPIERELGDVTRVFVSPGEAAQALGVHRSTVYWLIRVGRLRAGHIGRRCVIPWSELRRLEAEVMADAAQV